MTERKDIQLSNQQQRVLKLLFKFRFVSTQLLADVLCIGRRSAYEVLEILVSKGVVDKVYEKDYRYAKKPAYYFLNKQGVTTVRKIMDVKAYVVHALYKNDSVTTEFIEQCLIVTNVHNTLRNTLPPNTQLFTKTEINRFKQFPKNRPDLYIRTPDGNEAIIVIAIDNPAYIIRKRMDEIINHSEEEGWSGNYPAICFVLKDSRMKNSLIYTTNQKLESMGMGDDELQILVTDLPTLTTNDKPWVNVNKPKETTGLFTEF